MILLFNKTSKVILGFDDPHSASLYFWGRDSSLYEFAVIKTHKIETAEVSTIEKQITEAIQYEATTNIAPK